MTSIGRGALGAVLASFLATVAAHAASQTILGSKFLVKSPSLDATKRKVSGAAKEKGSPNTVVGNPIASGASLRVIANGGTDSDQTFSLPAAGWSVSGGGFKYSNKTTGGAVRKASIRRTPGGTFQLKVALSGSGGALNVVPPNPGDDGGYILTLTGGDSYCVAFGGAVGGTESKDDARTWLVKRPVGQACPSPVASTTTTSTTTVPGSTATTTTSTISSSTTTTLGSCNCCDFTRLKFTTTLGGGGDCGDISPGGCAAFDSGSSAGTACTTNVPCNGGICMKDIACAGLYFGGGNTGVPLPAVIPDLESNITKIVSCDSTSGAFVLAATSEAETGDIRTCTSGPGPNAGTCDLLNGVCTQGGANGGHACTSDVQCGCLFGGPLPIPNPSSASTSTCIINSIKASTANPQGTGTCGGDVVNLDLPLNAEVYLTGDSLPKRCNGGPNPGGSCLNNTNCSPGGTCQTDGAIQPCPICNPTTSLCNGGADDGLPCTPENSASLGAAYPTSHDCRPNPPSLGGLPIGFALSTGTQTKVATSLGSQPGQARVFCGFCASTAGAFEGPPSHACTADTDCTSTGFGVCRQRTDGAFSNPIATSISATGAAAGCLSDGGPHPSTLVSVFCVPATGNLLVDSSGDLPGPGAVALAGVSHLTDVVTTTTVPGGSTTTTTGGPATTTTTTLLSCSGVGPLCIGGCPAGFACSAATAQPCTCVAVTTTTTGATTTTTTLLGCSGVGPVCIGGCPAGSTCGAAVAQPCTCVPDTTTTTTPTTTTAPSTTTSTLLGCSGVGPVCIGGCPAGSTCGAATAQPCTCVPDTTTTIAPTTTTTATSTTTSSTLLACGGIAPACLGSCPGTMTCTGATLQPCTCQ